MIPMIRGTLRYKFWLRLVSKAVTNLRGQEGTRKRLLYIEAIMLAYRSFLEDRAFLGATHKSSAYLPTYLVLGKPC